jgi:hypothetical protein
LRVPLSPNCGDFHARAGQRRANIAHFCTKVGSPAAEWPNSIDAARIDFDFADLALDGETSIIRVS